METFILKIDIGDLVQFLKKNSKGPEVVEALRYRAAIHFLKPELDPLSERMLKAYGKFAEIVEPGSSVLDAGCMSGYLNHFLRQRITNFTYVGLDSWDEALTVAREFQPGIDVRKCDILKDELPKFSTWPNGRQVRGFDYVWSSNIAWGENSKAVVEKLVPIARRACLFAQPNYALGDIEKYARELGEVDVIDCGKTTIYVIRK